MAVDGEELGLVELIGRAAALAGAHGVGRIDMIENRLVGIKSREVYETPAAALLLTAYAGVEELVCDRDLAHMKAELAGAVRDARLQRPLVLAASRGARRRSWHETSAAVTGTARVQALPRLVRDRRPAGRRRRSTTTASPTYEHGDSFQHGAAAGFIHIWSLPTKTWAAAGTGRGRPLPHDAGALVRAASRRPRPRRARPSRPRSRSTGGCCRTTCERRRRTCACSRARGILDAELAT